MATKKQDAILSKIPDVEKGCSSYYGKNETLLFRVTYNQRTLQYTLWEATEKGFLKIVTERTPKNFDNLIQKRKAQK